MKSLFKQEKKTGSFTIDFSKIEKCKGVLFIEVKPLKRLDTLILNGVESDFISHDNVFKLQCNAPMVSGILNFKPYNSDSNMQSVVRYLLVE